MSQPQQGIEHGAPILRSRTFAPAPSALDTFMKKLKKNKQEKSQHIVVAQVEGKRLKSGKRLMPSGLTTKTRKERAARSRKEADDADEGEATNETISFETDNGNSKHVPPLKPDWISKNNCHCELQTRCTSSLTRCESPCEKSLLLDPTRLSTQPSKEVN